MRRVQFIELHEQPWFPSSIRDEITDALQFGFRLSKAYAPVIPLLQGVLDSEQNLPAGGRSVVDLCSGGGGPWLDLWRELRGNPSALHICLTDKYPNLSAFQKVSAESGNHISFYPGSVDATDVPAELKGFRTMFTSFHHFLPDEARAVLQNAVDAREGIGIFEVTRRTPSTIALVLAWALMLTICTPWAHPFRWSRLLWTYLVPVIPLVLLVDGVVSCLRTYRPEELGGIVDELNANQYTWEFGELSDGGVPITYLIGRPGACVPGKVADPSCRYLEAL